MTFLARYTGVIPEICRQAGLWVVTVTGERVRLEARYRSADAAPAGATVWVDGEEFAFRRDQDYFIDVWQQPELMRGALHSVPPDDGQRVPAEVQHFTAVFSRRTGLPVQRGCDGRKWVIGIQYDDANAVRFFLALMGHRRWGMPRDHPFQLMINGESVGDELAGSIDQALAALTRQRDHGPAAASEVGEAPAGASNSVAARRASVIRV
jgi:hypothetical protein